MSNVLAEAPAIRRPRFTRVIRRALMMRIVGSDGGEGEIGRRPQTSSGERLAWALVASREPETEQVG